MQVTTRTVRNWADEGGIPDLTLAELDFRLIHALQAVYTDPFLRARLCLKGGTALNKLYLSGTNRLSVDLDLVTTRLFKMRCTLRIPVILFLSTMGRIMRTFR